MGFLRLRTKISVMLAILVTIPGLFLGSAALREQEKLLNKTVREKNAGLTALLASHIYRVLDSTRRHLEMIASIPEVRQMQAGSLAVILKEALDKDEILDGIVVVDPSLRIMARAEKRPGAAPKVGAARRYFTDALLDRYGRGSDSKVGVEDTRSPTTMSTLIVAPDETIGGVMQATVSGQYIRKGLDGLLGQVQAEAYEDLDVYVVTEDLQIIMASRGAEYEKAPRFPAEEVERGAGFSHSVPLRAFQAYQTPDWIVWVVLRPSARSPEEEVRRSVRGVIGGGVGLALLVGLLFATSLTRPVNDLANAALAISRGDLTRAITVRATDEIGELAESFELMRQNLVRMQGNLKDRIEELQTLYGVGRALSSTLDLNELLHTILERIMSVMKGERGSIMLYEEETDELRVEVARGIDPGVMKDARVKMGERVSGYVLQTGRPLLVQDTSASPNLARLKDGEVVAGTMLSVPLISKDKRLGVLNVSKSTPFTFDEKDQELFTALANQAAIAIENAKLYTLAITDELTKLYIRRFFYQRLREEMRRSTRYGKPLSLMMLDVDHFKKFNDTYGHQAGDEVLQFVARTLKECVRQVDIVARMGGEEFVVLTPELSEDEAYVPAERIRERLEKTSLKLSTGVDVKVTTSIGIATFPRDGSTRDSLIDASDQALYQAKRSGRNRVCFFKDIPKPAP